VGYYLQYLFFIRLAVCIKRKLTKFFDENLSQGISVLHLVFHSLFKCSLVDSAIILVERFLENVFKQRIYCHLKLLRQLAEELLEQTFVQTFHDEGFDLCLFQRTVLQKTRV